MSFIDWSDPEEMLGLLAEYVTDEQLAGRFDRERADFLEELAASINALAARAPELPARAVIDRLRSLHDSRPAELHGDPALVHLDDCIQELERIAAASGAREEVSR